MSKKRGRKASYVAYAGEEVRETIKGRDYGVSLHKNTKNYYMMIPTETGTKRKWLGSDISVAVVKFRSIVAEVKGQIEKGILVDPISFKKPTLDASHISPEQIKENPMTLWDRSVKLKTPIDESVFIEWLKKELQNPKELARKTGIEALAKITKLIEEDKDIKLSSLIHNYLTKKKTISPKEAENTEAFWKEFIKVINCKTVEQITLQSIHQYEDYLHSEKWKPKYIKNKMNKISTIVKYNCGRYYNSHLIQVYNWLRGLDRPEDDRPFNPVLISKEDFEKLFSVSKIKWKLFILLGLNSAMYPIDLTRLKKENINFNEGTIAFRRGKTGKVLAVSTLWDRTKILLEQYLKERKANSDYIFLNQFGVPYKSSGITNSFNETIRKRAGVDSSVKFNHLRDTFSTLAQDLGYPIEQINLVLGHQNKGMQDRYAVRNAGKLTRELCDAVEKELFNDNSISLQRQSKVLYSLYL